MVSRSARSGRPIRLRRLPLLGLAGAALTLLALDLVPRFVLSSAHIPPLFDVGPTVGRELRAGTFWTALGQTAATAAGGLVIALLAGIVLGVVLGELAPVYRWLASTLDFLRTVPPVALLPALVLVLTATQLTVVLVAVACFWIVVYQVIYGVRDVDPVTRETARSYGFSRLGQARHVLWPTVLPYLATGLRLGAATAIALTVTGGLVIGSPGLGSAIWHAQTAGDVDGTYALIVLTGLLGLLVNAVVMAGERTVLHWHVSTTRELSS